MATDNDYQVKVRAFEVYSIYIPTCMIDRPTFFSSFRAFSTNCKTRNVSRRLLILSSFHCSKQAVHYYNVMESKVLQATNTEAWGAPSSLMRSLADGTRETYVQSHRAYPCF
jgi:hypothetical protein